MSYLYLIYRMCLSGWFLTIFLMSSMRFYPWTVLVLLCLYLFSCRETTSEPVPKRESLFPLQPGAYWIYRKTVFFPNESFSVFAHLDSVWISQDTILDGKRYWVQRSTQNAPYFLRDSADCILRRNSYNYEHILYSENQRDTLLNDLPFYTLMTDNGVITRVAAGRFITRTCRSLLRIEEADNEQSDYFPLYTKPFHTTEFYISSTQVGLVKHVTYYLGNRIEYELIRYYIP